MVFEIQFNVKDKDHAKRGGLAGKRKPPTLERRGYNPSWVLKLSEVAHLGSRLLS
jgi:hypothetical protein